MNTYVVQSGTVYVEYQKVNSEAEGRRRTRRLVGL